MRGSTSTLKEYTVEEALKIFQEVGFTKLEMARSHLVLCKTHQLRQGFAAHAKQLGLSMGCLNAVGENYFEPFGTDEQKQRSLSAMKGDMEMALSLGTTDLMIWEGRAPEGSYGIGLAESALSPVDRVVSGSSWPLPRPRGAACWWSPIRSPWA